MLKRAVAIIVSIILIISLYITYKQPIFKDYAKTYEVSLSDYSLSQGLKKVNSLEFLFVGEIKGESCIIEMDNFKLNEFLDQMKAEIVFEREIDGVKSYYCYSNKIKYQKRVEGQVINLQIATTNKFVKVGSPIIYGSF